MANGQTRSRYNLLGNSKEVGKATVTAKDNWQYSFGNLPKYENGKAIVYTIQEDKVPGYATTTNGFDITNTHTTETTSISGKKTWADNHNQDGQRPDQITVHLLGNGKEVGKATVTAKDNWQYSFGNLPKYENGKAIVYTIQEDKVPGYATTTNGFDITNTHTTETTSISGKKTWADNHNQDGQRPDQITVHLLGNGKEVGKATVTAKDNWQYSFGNLPKYENGKAIVYTIQEDKVPGYATTTNGFDITNTRTKTPSTPGASSNSKTPGSQGPKSSNSGNSTASAGRLPQTNEQSNKGLMLMGLVLVVAVISYCVFQRKQRNN
jgi:LPXTG-motif cell wall-anchored protein